MNGLIGKKVGMTQIFSDNGDEVPVTVLELGPCPVAQVKTIENDGYSSVQLAFEPLEKKDKNKVKQPIRGHFAKSNTKPHRYLREFRVEEGDETKTGDTVTVDIFENTHYVSVSGISKGRGFAGVIKRHGFSGAPATRGSHEHFRHPGSIGMAEYPARVHKGKKMPGHMGAEKVTVLNLEVVKLFPEKNLLLVKGAVPGPNGGLVVVEQSTRKEKIERKEQVAKFVNPLKAAKRGGR